MAVYKRGETWWYKFTFAGTPYRESTKQGNKRIAEQIEAARKTQLAKGEVGIAAKRQAPTLEQFATRFMEAIEVRSAEKPRTVSFYREKLSRLLEFQPLASARLDKIDEGLIESYVQDRRKRVKPATVNRQLATLRRALRLAYDWKVIDRVPRIRMLKGERNRDFVLTAEQEKNYLATLPAILHDVAVLMLDTGLRVGEALALEWRDIHVKAGERSGYVQVREGKSKNARRAVSLTGRAEAMLKARKAASESLLYVFSTESGGMHLGTYLDRLHQRARKTLKLPPDFVLHSLRHTMLTRLGEDGVDAFTIMRIAGHSSIVVSQRYVHPSAESMERAIEKLNVRNRGEVFEVGTESGTTPKIADPSMTPNPLIPIH